MPGRDPGDRTRQICNGWKADDTIAAQVLHERIGKLGGQLSGWSGTRMLQDNVLWKPPGTKAIGFHQDASRRLPRPAGDAHLLALAPRNDRGRRAGRVRPRVAPVARLAPERSQFHAPEDWLAPARSAAKERRSRRCPSW